MIRQKHEIEKNNKLDIEKVEKKIGGCLTIEEQNQYWDSEKVILDRKNSRIKKRHIGKFERLREQQRKNFGIMQNENWFVNKTDTDFPYDVKWLLSLGQKHAIPTTRGEFPIFKYIADGEDCIQTLDNREEQEMARTKFTFMNENYLNKRSLDKREKFILNTVGQTESFLKKNKNIYILNADKGNVTVAMDTKDYETRMNDILNDMMTYKRLIRKIFHYVQFAHL